MKTLILKHNGYEAHVPYELPDAVAVDCFVPGYGVYKASVDVRAEDIEVLEVRNPATGAFLELDEIEESERAAVIEQAGVVVRTFMEALPIEWSECAQAKEDDIPGWGHRLALIESSWMASTRPSDMKILSTIAEMAHLESDLHTAWCRMPAALRPSGTEPPDPRTPEESHAHLALQRFISEVLVPRAQDFATAAAKRREAQWNEEQDTRCEHCDGSGEGRCGGRCPCCTGRGRPTARLTDFAKEGA